MPEFPDPAIESETIRRMASEEVMLSLTQAEVEALHNMLNSLLEEIRQISPRDRAGAEPEVSVVVRSGRDDRPDDADGPNDCRSSTPARADRRRGDAVGPGPDRTAQRHAPRLHHGDARPGPRRRRGGRPEDCRGPG